MTTMGPVFVFPGQGSQRRGMGADLFDRFPDLVAEADSVLGYSVVELCLRDPDRVLNKTQYTQPALYVVSVLQYLARGERPAVVAGHSLGEYCALFAAGAFDFATGVRLVRKRGELMAAAPKGAMAAVVNLDQERVAQILADLPDHNIDLSNVNSRQQCTLSGAYEELFAPEVREAYVAAGASFIPLNVSAAFHSRGMAEVEAEFARFLSGFTLHRLRIPVVANWTARPYPETDYAENLIRQISNPVRWYESMSWLLSRGHRAFEEIGPGTVLTKLTNRIIDDPLPIADPERPRLVFLYGGQGTQYHLMGKGLYDTHPAFRAAMDHCDRLHTTATGTSLVNHIYDPADNGPNVDDVRFSHPALFALGHALTETMRHEGFEPDAVLGHSLGEYVAATVAGVMTLEDAFDLVIRQAHLLATLPEGGMLSILAPPDLFERRDLFTGVSLAAVNFSRNFVISGPIDRLHHIQSTLDTEGVVAVPLPVRQPFHSALLNPHRPAFLHLADSIIPRTPTIPMHSPMLGAPVGPTHLSDWPTHLWNILRNPVHYNDLITATFPSQHNTVLVDLSATGSFANFAKHTRPPGPRCIPAINQFGKNTTSLDHLLTTLENTSARRDLVTT